MKRILILFFLSATVVTNSQTISTICDSLDTYWSNFSNHYRNYVSLQYMESAPELLTNRDSLIIKLKGEDSLFINKDTIKVFTKFYVNKDGNPICIKVINTVKSELESFAIRKVSKYKFKPAISSKKIIIVPYTLPIIFIKDSK